MEAKLEKISQMAIEAEQLLFRNSTFTRSEGQEPLESQKAATFKFLKTVQTQVADGKLEISVLEKMEVMNKSIADIPVKDREQSFKCVASYKACKADANTIEDKILCGVALAICFAKEIIPRA